MEFFLLGLTGDLEQCIIDKDPHNYEMSIKMTYQDLRLSVTKKIPVQYRQSTLEQSTDDFVILKGDELHCFEEIFRKTTVQRTREHQLGSHHITYFYSDGLVAMPDYTYDAPVPSYPILIGIDIENFLELF